MEIGEYLRTAVCEDAYMRTYCGCAAERKKKEALHCWREQIVNNEIFLICNLID